MKPLNALAWLLFVYSSPLLLSCGGATIHDVPVFEDMQPRVITDSMNQHLMMIPDPVCQKEIGEIACGHGVFIVSGKEIFIGEAPAHMYKGKPWSVLKEQSIYVPAVESFAPIEQDLINMCAKNSCNDQVDKFRVKLDSLNGVKAVLSR